MDGEPERLVHATCVAIDGRAALIRGPSGSGKSDLALRAITTPLQDGEHIWRTRLVADDQVIIATRAGSLVARPPPAIAGRIEIRGMGILTVDHLPQARLCLAVDLDPSQPIDRMPEPATTLIDGWRLPILVLRPFEASAIAKLVLSLVRAELPVGRLHEPHA